MEDERLLARIRDVHRANYEAYGYRGTWKALVRAGEDVPRCQVQRLMRSAWDPGRQASRQAVTHHDPPTRPRIDAQTSCSETSPHPS